MACDKAIMCLSRVCVLTCIDCFCLCCCAVLCYVVCVCVHRMLAVTSWMAFYEENSLFYANNYDIFLVMLLLLLV